MAAGPRAIVVMGVAGSGKTTVARALARHYGYMFMDADDFHTTEARERMAGGVPLTDALREPWVDVLADALCIEARQGRSCALAFSGLRAAHRQRLRGTGLPISFVFLNAPPHVIAARLAERGDHFMPPALLASQLQALEPATGEPDVIAVDGDRPMPEVLDRILAALDSVV